MKISARLGLEDFVPIILYIYSFVAIFLCLSGRYYLEALLGYRYWYLDPPLKGATKFLKLLRHNDE